MIVFHNAASPSSACNFQVWVFSPCNMAGSRAFLPLHQQEEVLKGEALHSLKLQQVVSCHTSTQ